MEGVLHDFIDVHALITELSFFFDSKTKK